VTYFLLVFDRRQRRLIEDVIPFADADEAVRARFRQETVHAGEDIEVVVLGAADREALENTHSRYFGSGRELSMS
jgi:hypothetical protein